MRSPIQLVLNPFQTVDLLRSLIILTQSLTPLPESRYLSMKLWYYDDKVPEEYEPAGFRAALPEEQLKFEESPSELAVGKLETGYHGLAIKCKTLESVEERAQQDAETTADTPMAEEAKAPTAIHLPQTSTKGRVNAGDKDLRSYILDTGVT
eukprot:GHVN01101829.1.p1 GENE.GHVN01101829.1~~GHVN01101829.1.p1  ORF type:complete len:152 (-),score=13.06 GHVN01101829.1:594-1049(-)